MARPNIYRVVLLCTGILALQGVDAEDYGGRLLRNEEAEEQLTDTSEGYEDASNQDVEQGNVGTADGDVEIDERMPRFDANLNFLDMDFGLGLNSNKYAEAAHSSKMPRSDHAGGSGSHQMPPPVNMGGSPSHQMPRTNYMVNSWTHEMPRTENKEISWSFQIPIPDNVGGSGSYQKPPSDNMGSGSNQMPPSFNMGDWGSEVEVGGWKVISSTDGNGNVTPVYMKQMVDSSGQYVWLISRQFEYNGEMHWAFYTQRNGEKPVEIKVI